MMRGLGAWCYVLPTAAQGLGAWVLNDAAVRQLSQIIPYPVITGTGMRALSLFPRPSAASGERRASALPVLVFKLGRHHLGSY